MVGLSQLWVGRSDVLGTAASRECEMLSLGLRRIVSVKHSFYLGFHVSNIRQL